MKPEDITRAKKLELGRTLLASASDVLGAARDLLHHVDPKAVDDIVWHLDAIQHIEDALENINTAEDELKKVRTWYPLGSIETITIQKS